MTKGKSTWKYNKLLTARRNYFNLGGLANIAGAVGDIGGKLISNGLESKAGSIVSGMGNALGGIPLIGGFAKGALNLIGGGVNALFGSKMNTENIARTEGIINNLNNFSSNASDLDSLSNTWNSTAMGTNFSNKFIGRDGVFSNKAGKKARALREEMGLANEFVQNSLQNNADNIVAAQMQNLLGNYAAFGGKLSTHGADFTNGMIFINNGGSHESNPFEGVPMGVDENGTPNLVEEGETIFNDYVFSKRLTVPDATRNKYKLRGTKDISFAEASKQMAKESEERPNDPISERGLQALMVDLASSQESVKNNNMNREFANGGHLFVGGGLKYNNDRLTENDPLYDTYKDYLTDGAIDFSKLYASNSPWMQKRNQISTLLDNREGSKAFREWYATQLNDYNKGRKGYTPYSADDITKDLFDKWSSDKKLGFGHNVIGYKDVDQFLTPRKTGERRYLLGLEKDANGTPLDPYATATIIDNYDPNNTAYSYVSKKNVSEGDTDYTDYYYRKLDTNPTTKKDRYFIKGKDSKYTEYTGNDPSLYMKNNGLFASSNNKNNTGGTDYFYDPQEEVKQGRYADWLRYAPAVGFGISAITDALEFTNKPDYSNADAILEATRNAGTYQPVRFNPIGNYLTYRPFDRDFYINKMNAEAGATRRSIANRAGGNRGTAMASILAADNNFLNQIGGLARQAEEYNLAQRQQVEDFNRATNNINSQGFLQADIANQKALMESGEFGLKGVMAAAQMRESARQAANAAKSANLSGLFQTLGDIGFEEKNARMRDWAIKHGIFGPGTEDYGRFKRSKGGKIKRRKGLTF